MNHIKNYIVDSMEYIYSDSYNEIIPNIYLGSKNSATDKSLLDKIDLVINCSQEIPFFSSKTKNLRVDVPDNLSLQCNLNILVYLHKFMPIIMDYYDNNKRILIHCRAGMQRSATVVACFLMKKFRFNKDTSIQFIRAKRPIAFFPGPNFNLSLELFQRDLENRNN